MTTTSRIDLKKIVGRGYGEFWKCKKRYRVVKGGRGSKKSTTTALNFIKLLTQYEKANLLVIRKAFNTHRDSTFAQLKWAINKLQLNHIWQYTTSPLEIKNLYTKQKILFRGLDDPLAITSITVDTGVLNWVWFEEAYQIDSEDDFDKIDGSIRGHIPEGYYKQLTLTLNPWHEAHWIKRRFFDKKDDDIFAITTNYMCNEWLDEADINRFEKLKISNPKKYMVEGLGEWGVSEGLVFNNWETGTNIEEKIKGLYYNRIGMDWGWNDPTTAISIAVDEVNNILYIYDEYYQSEKINSEIIKDLQYLKDRNIKITADSSEEDRIEEFRRSGFKIQKADKGQGSILVGISKIRDFDKVVIDSKCINTIKEFGSYSNKYDEATGRYLDQPIDKNNHCIDAIRYSLEEYKRYKPRQSVFNKPRNW